MSTAMQDPRARTRACTGEAPATPSLSMTGPGLSPNFDANRRSWVHSRLTSTGGFAIGKF